MAYLEELLPEFRKGAKIRCDYWDDGQYIKLLATTSYYASAKRLKMRLSF